MTKKQLVIGLGISGKGVIRFLLSQNQEILLFDDKVKGKIDQIEIVNDFKQIDLQSVERAILSPGIKLDHPLVQKIKEKNIEILGEVEFAFRHLDNYAIGITGTNGKTSTTLLLAHVLNNLGKKARALGNVGTPLSEYLLQIDPSEILVVELSSFQIETLSKKCLNQVLILNITPDHLDRYDTVEEYAKAKCRIKECIKNNGILYASKEVMQEYCKFLQGMHKIKIVEDDIELASKAILQDLNINDKWFLQGTAGFEKPKHRMELVRKIDSISFYNDSKATNVFSVLYGIKKLRGPIILIAGGLDKGFGYQIWQKEFEGKVKKIFAIGKSAKKIKNDLKGFFEVEIIETLELAVNKAYSIAKESDSIVLSPGCASYDMFKNYEDRGDKFKQYVNNLAK